jgi:microcompartment protein CcmL/EutN
MTKKTYTVWLVGPKIEITKDKIPRIKEDIQWKIEQNKTLKKTKKKIHQIKKHTSYKKDAKKLKRDTQKSMSQLRKLLNS